MIVSRGSVKAYVNTSYGHVNTTDCGLNAPLPVPQIVFQTIFTTTHIVATLESSAESSRNILRVILQYSFKEVQCISDRHTALLSVYRQAGRLLDPLALLPSHDRPQVHKLSPDMAALEADLSSLSLKDEVEAAVKAFEAKQVWSNQQWLLARADEDDKSISEQERIERRDKLAKGFGFDTWSELSIKHQVNSPRDVLTLSADIGQHDRGTCEPVSESERKAYLSKLQIAVDGLRAQIDPDFPRVPLPPGIRGFAQHH